MAPYERIEVAAAPDVVVAALREALGAKGLTEYAIVDHGRDMAQAGAGGIVAWTLVFGNPAAGAKVLLRDLGAAVDLPLRLAVIGTAPGRTEVVLRNTGSLLGDDLSDLAEVFDEVLRGLVNDARQRVEDPHTPTERTRS